MENYLPYFYRKILLIKMHFTQSEILKRMKFIKYSVYFY